MKINELDAFLDNGIKSDTSRSSSRRFNSHLNLQIFEYVIGLKIYEFTLI